MSDRSDVLLQIADLARRHNLSAEEIAAALGAPRSDAASGRGRATLVRVLGYLGGTFVFAGIGVFVALQWESMNAPSRVVVTLGSGVAALALGLLAAREEQYEKAAMPLLLVAAALEPTGMLVVFGEYGSGGDWRWASLVTSGAMALQFGGLAASLGRSTPLFLAIVFAVLFWWTAFDLLGMGARYISACLGGSMLLAAVGLDRTRHAEISPVWYLLGSAALLYGLFDIVRATMVEALFLAAAAAFVYVAALVRSRTLLFVSTLAILAYTGYFTGRHFADSIGWPLALIAFGIFMIAMSALAFRIDREYVRRA